MPPAPALRRGVTPRPDKLRCDDVAAIHPIEIAGQWVSGFALDYHTISSVCIGYDEYGHPIFDTKYTDLGGLLYRLKFKGDNSVVDEIVETLGHFVKTSWKPPLSIIIPMPPSSARASQPVFVLADALGAHLGLTIDRDAVAKTKTTPQLKNIYDYNERIRLLLGAFFANPEILAEQRVLLFDDLYRSGATMNSVATVIREQGRAAEIYALTVTRTRVKR